MELVLIRHTRVAIESGICYGQADILPVPTFREEISKIKEAIGKMQFDRIFSSPLKRCSMLAAELFPKEEVCFDERVKELYFGEWELQTWEAVYALPGGRKWMNNFMTERCAGGEGYPDLHRRVSAFLEELVNGPAERVAVVTHAGVIRSVKAIIDEVSFDRLFDEMKLEYGQVVRFRFDKEMLRSRLRQQNQSK